MAQYAGREDTEVNSHFHSIDAVKYKKTEVNLTALGVRNPPKEYIEKAQ